MTNQEKLNLTKNFKKLSKAKANAYYSELKFSNKIELSDCYNNYSKAKENAYNYCRDFCTALDGYHFRITGYNCNTFTCGYLFDTNENQYIIVHTRDYNYIGLIK